MERDDGEPAAWAKDPRRGGEAAFEVRDLAIHGNAERLEHVGRWVDRPPPPQLHAGDEASELVRCLEPVLRATTTDRGSHAPRLRSFVPLGDDCVSQYMPVRKQHIEARCRVPARPARAVEVASAIARLEPRENYGHENRFMRALGGLATQFGATRSRGP